MTTVLGKLRGIRERLRLTHEHLDELEGSYTPEKNVGEANQDASLLEKLNIELDIVEHQVICLAERIFNICNVMGGTPTGPRPPEPDDMLYACGTWVQMQRGNLDETDPHLEPDDIIFVGGNLTTVAEWNMQRGADETDPCPTGPS